MFIYIYIYVLHCLQLSITLELSGPGVSEPGDLAVQSTSRAVKNWIESKLHARGDLYPGNIQVVLSCAFKHLCSDSSKNSCNMLERS